MNKQKKCSEWSRCTFLFCLINFKTDSLSVYCIGAVAVVCVVAEV